MASAYRLFPFFAEGPFFHVLDCLVLFTTYAVTANQLDSNQPRHSHCMSVVMYDYILYMYIFTVWTPRLRELWFASKVTVS